MGSWGQVGQTEPSEPWGSLAEYTHLHLPRCDILPLVPWAEEDDCRMRLLLQGFWVSLTALGTIPSSRPEGIEVAGSPLVRETRWVSSVPTRSAGPGHFRHYHPPNCLPLTGTVSDCPANHPTVSAAEPVTRHRVLLHPGCRRAGPALPFDPPLRWCGLWGGRPVKPGCRPRPLEGRKAGNDGVCGLLAFGQRYPQDHSRVQGPPTYPPRRSPDVTSVGHPSLWEAMPHPSTFPFLHSSASRLPWGQWCVPEVGGRTRGCVAEAYPGDFRRGTRIRSWPPASERFGGGGMGFTFQVSLPTPPFPPPRRQGLVLRSVASRRKPTNGGLRLLRVTPGAGLPAGSRGPSRLRPRFPPSGGKGESGRSRVPR